ncbi:MAG TPA: WD40 repeat domain-containing protein, partial [Gemmataceae bacterium]
IRSAALCRGHQRIALGGLGTTRWKGEVRFVEVNTGRELASFKVANGIVDCVVISPNGNLLAAGCSDKRVRLRKIGLDD